MIPARFTIDVPQATLDDLRLRLRQTRWIDDLGAPGWERGLDIKYLAELVSYWGEGFDWRAQERMLNEFSHHRVALEGSREELHFIHERGRGPRPLPILLTHGFPDSFTRFAKVIGHLCDPAAHGGDPEDAFDVVVPSLPGYGFSDKPVTAHATFHFGDRWHALMTALGYERYAAHGGDWGSTVTELLARDHAKHLVGIHLTDVPFFHAFGKPSNPSAAERRYLDAIAKFPQGQGAYALVQGAQPWVPALPLNDSPAGLAGWIVEKFRRWSDCDGDVERCFSKDELLTNVTIYWTTGTIGSAFLPYHDFSSAGAMTWIGQRLKQWMGESSQVPAAFAMFPKDISSPPREWAERFFNVQRWTEFPHGGHFAAMEQPQLLVEDLRAFFRPLRPNA
jgi:microsomal epoxide hydrolase